MLFCAECALLIPLSSAGTYRSTAQVYHGGRVFQRIRDTKAPQGNLKMVMYYEPKLHKWVVSPRIGECARTAHFEASIHWKVYTFQAVRFPRPARKGTLKDQGVCLQCGLLAGSSTPAMISLTTPMYA